jgi:hypothetical protein
MTGIGDWYNYQGPLSGKEVLEALRVSKLAALVVSGTGMSTFASKPAMYAENWAMPS